MRERSVCFMHLARESGEDTPTPHMMREHKGAEMHDLTNYLQFPCVSFSAWLGNVIQPKAKR